MRLAITEATFNAFTPAVQDERQRAKERRESEVDSLGCANEDMPVESIEEAELAVELKTKTCIKGSLGMPTNSVSSLHTIKLITDHLLYSMTI